YPHVERVDSGTGRFWADDGVSFLISVAESYRRRPAGCHVWMDTYCYLCARRFGGRGRCRMAASHAWLRALCAPDGDTREQWMSFISTPVQCYIDRIELRHQQLRHHSEDGFLRG